MATNIEKPKVNKLDCINPATGKSIGKSTIHSIADLKTAIEKDLTVFFLTSTHTQHRIAIETLKRIKDQYDPDFLVADIIGKKWMCSVPGIETLYSNEFSEYCRKQREEFSCEFYTNTKNKSNTLTASAKKILADISKMGPIETEQIIAVCKDSKLCPYEIALVLASSAKVVVADYYYIFNPTIRDLFFKKAGKNLAESVIIVDEGHNLPNRIRDLSTVRLSNLMIKRALKEAKKHGLDEVKEQLALLQEILLVLSRDLGSNNEKLITKDQFINAVSQIREYGELIADLEFMGDAVREASKQSYIGSIASFLDAWQGEDSGFARIINTKHVKNDHLIVLSYRCLDPSSISGPVIQNSYSTIIMSGTLLPAFMYNDLLGFPKNTIERVYESPFSKKNRLNLIIPKTSTKFTLRSEGQYKNIADVCSEITNIVPGNSALFFPSYALRDSVYRFFMDVSSKSCILEKPNMSKEDKLNLLDTFKDAHNKGAVLLAVSGGNFSEGIDLPGDFLKAVIVIGLPLQQPDLEIKSLISYFDKKFQCGWDYGYLFPAFNKVLQSAGRCIRSESDRGVIIFLDERYAWRSYYSCFPEDWDVRIEMNYLDRVADFFEK